MNINEGNRGVEGHPEKEPRSFEEESLAHGMKSSHHRVLPDVGRVFRDIGLDSGWPDWPAPLGVSPESQAPYPVHFFPDDLAGVLGALQRLAQCPPATAAAALLGAVALLVQTDYAVQTLAEQPAPCSLFCVAMAESGYHKSAAFNMAVSGHAEADARLEARWVAAKERYDQYSMRSKDEPAEAVEPGHRLPRPRLPLALLTDVTADGLLHQLQWGRPSTALWESEIGTQFNYAFAGNRQARTLGYLTAAWDGARLSTVRAADSKRHIYLPADTYALSIVWSAQPDLVLPILLSQSTSRGFLARCLVSLDEDMPDLGSPEAGDRDLLQHFHSRIIVAREVQDVGMEYDPPTFRRGLVSLSRDAHTLLDEFDGQQRQLAVKLRRDRRRHEQSMAARAPEQAARVAACFTAWNYYPLDDGPIRKLVTDEECIQRAIALVTWYQGELSRIAQAANTPSETSDADHLVKLIVRVLTDPLYREVPNPMVSDQGVTVKTLANRRGTPAVRVDPRYRDSIIKLLVDCGYIRPSRAGNRGRFETHPRISDVSV